MINDTQQLSERERQILYLVASGRSNQQIANELGISINTVKVHLRNVFGKIGAASRTEASMYAVRAGIITVDRAVTGSPTTVESETQLPPVIEEPLVEILAEAPVIPEQTTSVPEESVVLPQADEPLLTAPSTPIESPVPTLPAPIDPIPPQHSAQALPAIERTADRAIAPAHRRSLPLTVLLLISLAVVGLGGSAVAWYIRPDAQVADQARDAEQFNLTRWRDLPAIPRSRAGFAMAAAEGGLFIIAGENENGVLNSVQLYDPETQLWIDLAQKPAPVADVRAVTLGEKLYVPGGRRSADPKDISAVFERYDPRADRWEQLADLPEPRSGYALATLEGRLYLFGGWDGTAYRDEVFVYDLGANSWSEVEAMPTARAFADAAVIESSIFVIGGENKAGPVANNEQYIPSQEDSQPWVNRPPMPRPRSRFGSAVALSNIYVFGGDAASDSLQYDARSERWQTFAAPTIIGNQPGVTLFDELIMIVGGKSSSGTYSTKMYSYQALFRTLLPNSQ